MDPTTRALAMGASGTSKARPTFVASAGKLSGSTGSTSFSINVPSGVQNGDMLIAVVSAAAAGGVGSWTQASFTWALRETNRNPNLGVAYRIANNEPGSYTFTLGNTGTGGGHIFAYRGAGWDTIGAIATTSNSASLAANSITISQSNAILLGAWAINEASETFGTPSGMAQVVSGVSTSNPNWIVYSQNVGSGSTGTKTATLSPNNGNSSAVLFSIIPA